MADHTWYTIRIWYHLWRRPQIFVWCDIPPTYNITGFHTSTCHNTFLRCRWCFVANPSRVTCIAVAHDQHRFGFDTIVSTIQVIEIAHIFTTINTHCWHKYLPFMFVWCTKLQFLLFHWKLLAKSILPTYLLKVMSLPYPVWKVLKLWQFCCDRISSEPRFIRWPQTA